VADASVGIERVVDGMVRVGSDMVVRVAGSTVAAGGVMDVSGPIGSVTEVFGTTAVIALVSVTDGTGAVVAGVVTGWVVGNGLEVTGGAVVAGGVVKVSGGMSVGLLVKVKVSG